MSSGDTRVSWNVLANVELHFWSFDCFLGSRTPDKQRADRERERERERKKDLIGPRRDR